MKNKINSLGGLVYSTDPTFKMEQEIKQVQETLLPGKQLLKITLDKKQRAGKMVTIVSGFVGKMDDLEQLGKVIKTFCGTGGSVKDGLIIVQGDNRDKLLLWAQKNGYNLAKKA